jgi:alkanesulfonate monooxygenase SsuD/methylene tetrahydromethanopterin reductase-like flavin-dependent oxidoreductase (luciferase family)
VPRWRRGTGVWGDPGLGVIRTGIVLPTFRETPDDALRAAHEAFEAGVDGVFCYDHIWPLGEPDRPALAPFPVLAALAAITSSASAASRGMPTTPGGGPYFGTLVARVGLVPNGVLLGQFRALDLLAPGRIIAGLGTGDRLSEAENRAYGIPFPPAAERRADMVELGRALRALDIPVWVAGGPAARVIETRAVGGALNVWDAEPALVASRAQGPEAVEVTWGGPPPKGGATLERRIVELAQAGATWAIFGWPIDPGALAAAAREAG